MLLLLLVCLVVCVFVCVWDVRHTHKKRASTVKLPSALMTIVRWWLFSLPHLLWHGASINIGHLRTNNTHICCWVYGSRAVATRFYDLDLSRIKFKHPTFKMRSEHFKRLSEGHSISYIGISRVCSHFNLILSHVSIASIFIELNTHSSLFE